MSMDFALTHFFRLVAYDLVLLKDTYMIYSQCRKRRRNLKEFAQVIANLIEVEAQNFEDIDTARLSHDDEGSLLLIVWDYFHDVILKHILDDCSQFPFWAAKVVVTNQPGAFGTPVIKAYWEVLRRNVLQRTLLEGCVPYLTASAISNYRYLMKVTHSFIVTCIGKFPPPAQRNEADAMERGQAKLLGKPPVFDSTVFSSNPPASTSSPSPLHRSAHFNDLSVTPGSPRPPTEITNNSVSSTGADAPAIPTQFLYNGSFANSGGGKSGRSAISKKRRRKSLGQLQESSYFMRLAEQITIGVLSHPFVVLSVAMVTNPLYQHTNCVIAYFKMLANTGVPGLYRGLRARIVLRNLPVTAIMMVGIGEMVIFRRMSGHGTDDSTGGILSVLREIVSEKVGSTAGVAGSTSESGGVGDEGRISSIFNYGLLTAVHILPGFLSFVTVRTATWLLFGSSMHRRNQFNRRNEIVEAHIHTIDKKANPY